MQLKDASALLVELATRIDYLCHSYVVVSRTIIPGRHAQELIHRFLQIHFLHWLEALSLGGLMSKGVIMLKRLETLLKSASG